VSTGHILFDGVSKQFRLGDRADALRDLVPRLLRRALGRVPPPDGAALALETRAPTDGFWALRNVSFEVLPGRVLGIIGPNGAGKSTILKLLTGILRPTTGRVHVRGRTGALIEVSAGFHGDLTGRENIYLQGAVLGMDRREIARRFDEIVAFAGVAEFIDTPVKRYSSGMNARLGFAVAAHLDPDVLLIDEVLSVGDREFQQRAVRRISELVRGGVPAVFISHNLERIASLCTDALLLVHGDAIMMGSPAECISAYLEDGHVRGAVPADGAPVRFSSAVLAEGTVPQHGELRLRISGEVGDASARDAGALGCRLQAVASDEVLCAVALSDFGLALPPSGPFDVELSLRAHLTPGTYRLQVILWRTADASEWLRGPALSFEVTGARRQRGPADLEPQLRLLPP
jgi:ABC-type polysaccharide/polyol phosphate transport system ATPase subunit